MPAPRLKALHINWTAPFFAGRERDGGGISRRRYALPFYELLTTLHSALAWKKRHGPVKLYTDDAGARYYQRLGLLDLYNAVDTRTLQAIDTAAFNPRLHFTFGKIAALASETVPFVMMDTDLVIERRLSGLHGARFVFAHWETVDGRYYARRGDYPNPNRVSFTGWDFSLRVCNTAIAYFGHRAHRDAFAGAAIRFLRHNDAPWALDPKARALFAEQRLCAFEAKRQGVPLLPLVDATWDSKAGRFAARRGQPVTFPFHHTWVRKAFFRSDPASLTSYCVSRLARLALELPDALALVQRWPSARPYLRAFDALAA